MTRNSSITRDNDNLLLGNPSKAGRDANNYLLQRPQHAMSYNASNGGPNWVAWHLDKSDLGNARRSQFLPDPMLPASMQIRPTDYRGSGYDRGHVCPSGDRTRDSTYNKGTFVMSNMLPQAAALNQQVWRKLEEYERLMAKSGNELYIIAGGAGSISRIGGKINVPDVCWKILVILPNGDNDLARINSSTRVIAVSMPNRDRAEIGQSQWAQWITTPAQLEKTTGLNFLSNLPLSVQRALEQSKDSGRATASRTTASRNNRSSASSATPIPVVPMSATPREEPTPIYISPSNARTTETTRTETTRTQVAPTETASVESAPAAASSGQVWVNTNSGIYHYPGARWYGTTKEGQYMTEAAAEAAGYRAARNGQ